MVERWCSETFGVAVGLEKEVIKNFRDCSLVSFARWFVDVRKHEEGCRMKIKMIWIVVLGGVLMLTSQLGLAQQPPGFPQVYVVTYDIEGEGTVVVSPASDDGRTTFTADTLNVTYTAGPGLGLTLILQAIPATEGYIVRWELGRAGQPSSEDLNNPTTLELDPECGTPSFWIVRAFFEAPVHTITATAGPGGTIEPSGEVTVPHGGSQTFTIIPNTGYEIAEVLVDGESVGPVSTYTFSNVTANHMIHATFRRLALYMEDFEDGAPDWTKSGLWHVCNETCDWCVNAPLEGKYAHYAIPGQCSYDTGRRTLGYLTSPVIPVPQNTELVLMFDFARFVENYPRATRDRTYVQIRLGRGSWRTVWSRSSRNPSPECGTSGAILIRTGRYTTLQIRFVFDSVNRYNNNFPGWAVDNVMILPRELLPAGIPLAEEYVEEFEPLDEEEPFFVLTVFPNPVTGRTVVFGVDGVEAEALQVEVYDLGGRLVYRAETLGGQLTWDTLDFRGQPVANGVYLVLAKVKVDGEWLAADLQKILILR